MIDHTNEDNRTPLTPQVREALARLQTMVSALIDEENSPAVCYVVASEALLRLCQECMVAQSRRWDEIAAPPEEVWWLADADEEEG